MMGPSLISAGGRGADVVVTDGYVDVGAMRMAWGKADSPTSGVSTVNFPAPFAAPPVVQLTGVGPAAGITPKVITTTGFVVGEVNSRSNPMPFGWMAIGQNPDAAPAPSAAFDVPGLPVWSAAVRAQRAGLRPAKVLCIGDSTTAGHGAVAADMGSNAKSASYPTQLAERFVAKGSAASWASFLGNQVTFDVPGYDNRITIGAGWTTTANGYGQMLGGYGMISAETTRTRFAPTSTVDTFEIYTLQRLASTAPMFVVSVDDVDVSTIWSVHSQDAPGILMKTVVKTSLGTHSVAVRSVATNINVQLAGILAYNSVAPEICVLNAGWAGGKASSFANGQSLAWSPLSSIAIHNADLVIINLGINDMNQATPTTKVAYVSQMQEIITAAVSTGADVVLVIPNAIGGTYTANHEVFAGYIQELAAANGLTVVDVRTKLGTYAAANVAGYMRDTVHPTGSGYLEIAEAIQEVIMP
ncbi:hypothetical protein GOL99_12270 [Sinorhizobium medicae]|nr:hypothetical protein [Sinorhizobium medicae]